ncbi:hypothetical protein EVAR_78101_1 [Eumeta japonica]|uniref:Uncharacterized protein n=1 Tax=Eumeta variegata TaxID=151549 RepID=A0A4C1T0B6_EUMVA|nr:hypothetical protein EVAR_78101_1 [Eumeta japonica]
MTCGEGLVEEGSLDDAGAYQQVPSSHRSTRIVDRHFLECIPPTEKQMKVTRVRKVCANSIKKETGKRGCKEIVYTIAHTMKYQSATTGTSKNFTQKKIFIYFP